MGTVKGDLRLREFPTDIKPVATGSNVPSFVRRASGTARNSLFILVYFTYLLLVMAPFQRLVIGPWCALRPQRRRAILRVWMRIQALVAVALARGLGGMRMFVEGEIEPTSCVVLMNHQSILDIPIGVSLIRGPYPLIPTRASYATGIPGISLLTRLMRTPLVTQGPQASRAELLLLRDAADQVARGENCILIYPEGHRSRSGAIQPFMKAGLKLILRRARHRPVYLVVVEGLTQIRSLIDATRGVAGTTARVSVRGPYNTPAEDVDLDAFMDELRDRMIEAQGKLREPGGDPAGKGPDPLAQE